MITHLTKTAVKAASSRLALFSTSPPSEQDQKKLITDGSHMHGGKLMPDIDYQTGEHAYRYRTDAQGRIIKASAGVLNLKTHPGRLRHDPDTPGKRTGDHAGHLFGDRFGGSPDLDNLVSQAQKVNLSEYKKIENLWAVSKREGKNVTNVNIEIDYDLLEFRPVSFTISYEIDGTPYLHFITQ